MHKIKIVEKSTLGRQEKIQPDQMKDLEVMSILKPQILILSKILMILVNMQFR